MKEAREKTYSGRVNSTTSGGPVAGGIVLVTVVGGSTVGGRGLDERGCEGGGVGIHAASLVTVTCGAHTVLFRVFFVICGCFLCVSITRGISTQRVHKRDGGKERGNGNRSVWYD